MSEKIQKKLAILRLDLIDIVAAPHITDEAEDFIKKFVNLREYTRLEKFRKDARILIMSGFSMAGLPCRIGMMIPKQNSQTGKSEANLIPLSHCGTIETNADSLEIYRSDPL